ncbi:MAG: NAD(+)/NADH kinase [Anaerolineae bacterium]|nr:NAD(+)/NADH kinase [Anaerolineae bacterium]
MMEKPCFKSVGILYHPRIPASPEMAEEIRAFLQERGIESWVCSAWDEPGIKIRLEGTSMLITLGGDGTILRAARVSVGHNVLILGLNLGRLGFLAEMTPQNWQEVLSSVLAGNYWTEERMMLMASFLRGGKVKASYHALNDVVVSRGTLARIVHLSTYIDGYYFTTYHADGLIVSTPTGSTAYALAAGGPILPPELHNILLIPIAPHLCLDKAVVLSEGSWVRIIVSTDHQAILTVDGQLEVNLRDGDEVKVQASPYLAYFARVRERSYFYQTLLERLRESY